MAFIKSEVSGTLINSAHIVKFEKSSETRGEGKRYCVNAILHTASPSVSASAILLASGEEEDADNYLKLVESKVSMLLE